jgi:hypothetical protein
MKIESVNIHVIHENKSYCLIGEIWFKSGEFGEIYPIHNEDLISQLKLSFEEMTKELSDCPLCKSELSYKNGVCRNGLCIMHYEEFMA